jgi:hypothetical protein
VAVGLTILEAVDMAAWFSEWGQMIYILVQMLFWVAIATAALMIALQYKRFVSHKVEAHGSRHAGHSAVPEPTDPRINIEEFVE